MTSSILVRWGSLGALLAAAGWTVSGIVALIFGVAPFGPVGSLSWYLIESSDALAEMGMMVLLVGLHVERHQTTGGWERQASYWPSWARRPFLGYRDLYPRGQRIVGHL